MAETDTGDYGEGRGAVQGSPGSAPRVRTPRASCPQAAEPRQCLAANKTAQSCFEPLFLGTWGDFLLPAASPCAWRSGVTRAGAGRGQPSRRDLGTHKNLFLCWRAGKAAPSAGRQFSSSITPTATSVTSPQAQLSSVVSSPGCQFFHRCPRGSATGQRPGSSCRGGALRGPPLPSKEEEEGSGVMNAVSNPCVAATPINDTEGFGNAAEALPCHAQDAPRAA